MNIFLKIIKNKFFLVVTAALSVCFSLHSLAQAPLETFYSDPLLSGISISPNGKKLLGLRHHQGNSYVLVYDLDKKTSFYPVTSDNVKIKFNWVRWANDQRILISLRTSSSERGLVFGESRLIAMDADKPSPMKNLYEPNQETLSKYPGWQSQFQDNIICQKASEPDQIYVSVDRDKPNSPSVYKVNVNNGRFKRVTRNRGYISDWYTDRDCNVRISEHYNDDTRRVYYKVLDTKTDAWVDAWSYTVLDEAPITPLGFGGNPNELYLLADHEGYRAIFLANLAEPNFPKKLIHSIPGKDVSGQLIYSERLKDVVGIYLSYTEGFFWNEEFKALQAGIDKGIPDSSNFIFDTSANERRYLVYSRSTKNPGLIYFGDRDKKTLDIVSQDYPTITDELIVEKSSITYKARDGIEIQAYLSVPKNSEKKPIATILFPHGGPMSEDTDDFDMFTTYFVNKGYAVLQPNFRGSSGRGFDFLRHAVAGFGLEMQDDLEDGINHLIAQNITDKHKVCIVGASYGGYAALMGAAKTPDLFQCAVSFAGLSDLVTMTRQAHRYTNKNIIREQIGRDKNQLKETSPIRLAKQIKIPVLLIHGARDTVVNVDQSRDMHRVLKRADKEVTYVELKEGTHHLDNLFDRKTTFEAIDQFLNQHLPL